MAFYALISPQDNPAVETALREKFPDHYFKIAPGQFMLSVDLTTQRLYEQLQIRENAGSLGTILILAVSNYTGHGNLVAW